MDWLTVCPPTGVELEIVSNDLFHRSFERSEIEFENEGGETYICGNPPYIGDKKQSKKQKLDIKEIFEPLTSSWKSLDYICGFFYKAYEFLNHTNSLCAFVSTNSIVQGQHVPRFWGLLDGKVDIFFAAHSFKWSNLAANKAGVTCVIVGLSTPNRFKNKALYERDQVRLVDNISPYLTPGPNIIVKPASLSISGLPRMTLGNMPKDDGGLLLTKEEADSLDLDASSRAAWTKKALGSTEFIQGRMRYCLWLSDDDLWAALENPKIAARVEHVKRFREKSIDPGMKPMAARPHQFREMNCPERLGIVVPRVSSENREFLPVGLFGSESIVTDRNYAIYDGDIWAISLIASRMHWVWIATVCVRMRTDFSYSNTLGWNTFPVPRLTEKNRIDLTKCAEEILLAREAHFPATIAELYDPKSMPDDLREAHERNDEVLERIYIGRRFKNDTERLEKLFDLYTKMTSKQPRQAKRVKPEQGRNQ